MVGQEFQAKQIRTIRTKSSNSYGPKVKLFIILEIFCRIILTNFSEIFWNFDFFFSVSSDPSSLQLDYAPAIERRIIDALIGEKVDDAVRTMVGYDLTKDDFEAMMEINQWPDRVDRWSKIPPKVETKNHYRNFFYFKKFLLS